MISSHPKQTRWRSDVAVYVISAALALGGTVQIVRAAQNRQLPPPRPIPQAVGQPADPVVSSRSASDVNVPASGRSRVVYLFAQACRFCESQKTQMQRILSALDREVVVTATDESDAIASAYWPAGFGALPLPGRIEDGAMAKLGLPGVPALLFVGPDGRVASAYVGITTAWDVDRFRSELARAEGGGH